MFIEKYITSFLSYIKYERRFSPHTIIAYNQDLNDFFNFLQSEYLLSDVSLVNHKQIRSWVVSLMNNGIVPKTINRKISSLRAFYKYLLSRKEITNNPLTKISGLKTPSRLPKFVDEKEINHLCNNIEFARGFEGARDKLIIEMFYNTGIRLSELVGIKDMDINHQSASIKVRGKGNKERIIPLHDSLLNEIKDYQKLREDKFGFTSETLFLTDKGKSIYHKFIYRKVKHYLSMVTTSDKKSPHVLRHTFATHLMNNGAELNAVKELLGHSSLAATQVYTHNTIQKLKDIHKQAHPKS